MAKVHLEAGPFGSAVCGKDNVDTSTDPTLVTCEACEKTEAFESTVATTPHEHRWVERFSTDGPLIRNEDGTEAYAVVPDGAECECGVVLTQAQWSARSPS